MSERMKFLYSAEYRREVIIAKPFKGFYRKIEPARSKRLSNPSMQIDFPNASQIERLKNAVDSAEMTLRGGGIVSDVASAASSGRQIGQGGLKAWDTVKTVSKSGNVLVEGMAGGHSLAESVAEWQKGHYVCCVCSGLACGFFWAGAVAAMVPGGYGVWQFTTQAGSSMKVVTYTCRQVTGGRGF
tara:strand:+ start:419 stop:973 length:555 start_codon:yes stop_codon:yes gene_type:complete